MVYLAGDNNLEDFGVKDLSEMKKVGSSDKVSVIAQFDSMSDQITRRYELTAGKSLEADCVDELPETNTGDPAALISFINWAGKQYEAKHYALVLWNHGSGWKDEDIYRVAEEKGIVGQIGRGQVRGISSGKPSRALFSTSMEKLVEEAILRAILFDDSAADFLDSQELKNALHKTLPAVNGKFDLLGFDACLMNMLELHYQVKGLCKFVVGSQETEPGDGWPYDSILAQLNEEPDMTTENLARIIVDKYVDSYKELFPNIHVTQSAVNVDEIEPIADAVSNFAECLMDSLDKGIGQIFTALRLAQSFTDRDYIDLAHFCSLFGKSDVDSDAGKAARKVFELMTGAKSPLVAEAHHGIEVKDSTGISIYLPTRIFSPLYEKLDFAKNYKWGDFLNAFIHPA